MSLVDIKPSIPWIAISSFGVAFLLGTYLKRQKNLKKKQLLSKKRRDSFISWDFSKLDALNKANEFVVFDLETTIPATDVIEFGAIVLDKFTFQEKARYQTLIHSTKITKRSYDCNHISLEMVKESPLFKNIADQIFELLNGRIWVGHNITRFDKKVIEDSFKAIGKPAPVPANMIDTLPLLKNSVGDRYGNLKLATLGSFFGLGDEEHRSVSDCEMNIQVLKNCALTVFIETHCNIDLIPEIPKPKQITNSNPNSNANANGSPAKGSSNPNNAIAKSPASSSPGNKSKGSSSRSGQKPKPNAIITKSPKPKSENNNVNNEQLPSAVNPEVYEKVKTAIEEKSAISILYSGGSAPGTPRKITPIRIRTTKKSDSEIFISALCHISNTEKTFAVSKITQILTE